MYMYLHMYIYILYICKKITDRPQTLYFIIPVRISEKLSEHYTHLLACTLKDEHVVLNAFQLYTSVKFSKILEKYIFKYTCTCYRHRVNGIGSVVE